MFTIFLLIVLQLIGESVVRVSGFPVPGAPHAQILQQEAGCLRHLVGNFAAQHQDHVQQNETDDRSFPPVSGSLPTCR
jgi:hypothetical protein